MHFLGVRKTKKKSKNDYCYKCWKFEKRRVCSEGSKMLLRKKYLKKIKNMRFFRGSHSVLVGWYHLDFSIFYYGIESAYLELPIQVGVEIRLSIKMRPPAGGPEAPSDQNFESS